MWGGRNRDFIPRNARDCAAAADFIVRSGCRDPGGLSRVDRRGSL